MPIPAQFFCSLSYNLKDVRIANTAPSVFNWGLFEFLNQRPMYTKELYTIYRYVKITGTRVFMETTNVSTEPLQMVVAPMPFTDVSGTNITAAIERRKARVRVVGEATGSSTSRINVKYTSSDILGYPVYDNTYWCSSSQSTVTTPLDTLEPVIYTAVGSLTGGATSWSGTTNYKITYDCEFFDLLGATIS